MELRAALLGLNQGGLRWIPHIADLPDGWTQLWGQLPAPGSRQRSAISYRLTADGGPDGDARTGEGDQPPTPRFGPAPTGRGRGGIRFLAPTMGTIGVSSFPVFTH